MKPFLFSFLALTLLSACATAPDPSPQAAPQGNYAMDPAHTSVIWSLSHTGLSHFTARFDDVSGALDYNPEAPQTSRVDIVIDPMSVNTGLPEFDQTIATDSKYLDAETYPDIRFTSTSITLTGDNTGLITGDLTLRGVTKPVTLNTTFNGAGKSFSHPGKTLGFSATGEFNRSDFGLDYLITLGNIGDKITLRIETEFNEAQ